MMHEMLTELTHIRNALLRLLLVFLVLTVVFFAVPVQFAALDGVSVPVPNKEGSPLVDHALLMIGKDLTPAGVSLVTSNPMDPFTVKITLAVVLSLLITLPYGLFELFLFVRPALYLREQKTLLFTLIISVCLFAVGAVFAYTLVIPSIFEALFTFLPEGVSPLYNVRELVGLVCSLVFAISTVFLLPIGMVLLSQTGLIPPSFWRTHAKAAVLLVFLLSAIITPDGSGVSMILLALPVCLLYTAGYLGSMMVSRSRRVSTNH